MPFLHAQDPKEIKFKSRDLEKVKAELNQKKEERERLEREAEELSRAVRENEGKMKNVETSLFYTKQKNFEIDQKVATLLPTLRGLKAVASYDREPEAVVSCPIHALMAEEDELGTAELMTPWAQRTTSGFDLEAFPGGHFYINDNLPELAHWVAQRIPRRGRP